MHQEAVALSAQQWLWHAGDPSAHTRSLPFSTLCGYKGKLLNARMVVLVVKKATRQAIACCLLTESSFCTDYYGGSRLL